MVFIMVGLFVYRILNANDDDYMEDDYIEDEYEDYLY